MEKLRCSNCKGKTVKNGFQKGKQRYKCTACGKRFLFKNSCQLSAAWFMRGRYKE